MCGLVWLRSGGLAVDSFSRGPPVQEDVALANNTFLLREGVVERPEVVGYPGYSSIINGCCKGSGRGIVSEYNGYEGRVVCSPIA